jgi:hypothetical protein
MLASMSREELIHTLRDALETLTGMTESDEGEIQLPNDDTHLRTIAEVPPRRTAVPPPGW